MEAYFSLFYCCLSSFFLPFVFKIKINFKRFFKLDFTLFKSSVFFVCVFSFVFDIWRKYIKKSLLRSCLRDYATTASHWTSKPWRDKFQAKPLKFPALLISHYKKNLSSRALVCVCAQLRASDFFFFFKTTRLLHLNNSTSLSVLIDLFEFFSLFLTGRIIKVIHVKCYLRLMLAIWIWFYFFVYAS